MAHNVADFEDYNPLNQMADIIADLTLRTQKH